MEYPENLFYTKDHEWVSGESGTVTVGVTAYAIEQLGDIVHVDLPDVGEEFHEGDSFGTIESTKTVSDLYMPGEAKVIEVNKLVANNPEEIQESPYDKGWLIKVQLSEKAKSLLNSGGYESYIKED
ncbi:MAG: glycine cleavage system protein GcvH [Oligoflexales bacterium]